MKIFCTDGTTVECAAFRALDSGILVFDEEPEEEEAHGEATGFVPITQLKYVLPDDAQPGPQQAQGRAQQPRRSQPAGIGGQSGGLGNQRGSIGLQQGSGGGHSQGSRGGGSTREQPSRGQQR